jgi:hypothetical protein
MTDRTDTITRVREHYNGTGLTDRIQSALATITPENQELTIAQLAPLEPVPYPRDSRYRRIGRGCWP